MRSPETAKRERRDWTLLIFIIPIGIILMLIAGQIAISLVPIWSVDAGMQSNLDPDLPMQQGGFIQPILPAILTPFGWFDTFLTPGADTVISDFIVLGPVTITKTAVPGTPTAAESATSSVSTLLPTATSSPIATITPTKQSNATATSPVAVTPSPTAAHPSATATLPPPTAVSPTAVPPTAVPPTAIPPTAIPPTAVPPTVIPPPPTATLSTPPPLYNIVTPPNEIGIDTPPDGDPGPGITSGTYTIVDIQNNPVVVSKSPDGNYDLIFYEALFPNNSGTNIQMDQIIIGVSNFQDGSYYQVFNWGDNVRDTNTNIDTNILSPDSCIIGAPECDNRTIQTSELYPSPGAGILIDVDAPPGGAPPEGSYKYLVIISPLTPPFDAAQVDSIQVTEVPIPPPIP